MRKTALLLLFTVAAAGLGVAVASSEPLGNETVDYAYDARGRLVQVKHTGSVNNNVMANYTYDKADNRVTVNVTGAP